MPKIFGKKAKKHRPFGGTHRKIGRTKTLRGRRTIVSPEHSKKTNRWFLGITLGIIIIILLIAGLSIWQQYQNDQNIKNFEESRWGRTDAERDYNKAMATKTAVEDFNRQNRNRQQQIQPGIP